MNLRKWIENPNNVYVGRRGRIFIDKEIFHYKESPFANPFKVVGNKTAEEAVKEVTGG